MEEKLKEIIDIKLKEAFDSENTFYVDGLKALDEDNISDAMLYFIAALVINPQNSKAKQQLLEIYPEAIQDVIDEGRYKDALALEREMLKLDNAYSGFSNLEFYFLKIKKNIISIAYTSTEAAKPLIKIIRQVAGPDTMLVPQYMLTELSLKGLIPPDRATIISNDFSVDILTIPNQSKIQYGAPEGLDVELFDEQGNKITSITDGSRKTFSLYKHDCPR